MTLAKQAWKSEALAVHGPYDSEFGCWFADVLVLQEVSSLFQQLYILMHETPFGHVRTRERERERVWWNSNVVQLKLKQSSV